MAENQELPVSDSSEKATEEKGSGCFYTINTLMILFFVVPAVVGVILFLLWLIVR